MDNEVRKETKNNIADRIPGVVKVGGDIYHLHIGYVGKRGFECYYKSKQVSKKVFLGKKFIAESISLAISSCLLYLLENGYIQSEEEAKIIIKELKEFLDA